MAGLKKRGPKHKKKKTENKKSYVELTDEDFRRMMEDVPTYRRVNGALRRTR